ncbi:hypothetical protein [Alienimonas californiensis]|uniref:Uncharacterized protein n=1 Tax=Alienimonas californiensis TaxID=2527989 RepID=A0A517P8W5_9PLAN|nr:hypothetical protein [Alienimonas californiensis]QDT15807.1 hypothetical protein CA12_19020 [Alienimonas californiensis]
METYRSAAHRTTPFSTAVHQVVPHSLRPRRSLFQKLTMPPSPARSGGVRRRGEPDLSDLITDLGDKESTMLEDEPGGGGLRPGQRTECLRIAAEAVRRWLADQASADGMHHGPPKPKRTG